MNKIAIIIKREYLTRVKKTSFIVMTFLGPVLMAALIIVPVWFATMEDESNKTVAVIDKSGQFENSLANTKNYKFIFISDTPLDSIKHNFSESGYQALLFIPMSLKSEELKLYSDKQPSLPLNQYISSKIERHLELENLQKLGVSKQQIDSAKTNINIQTIRWTEDGKDESSSAEITIVIGFIAAIIIYMFIFMYGAQVMRGIIEEKSGRVVEIIVSSVKPFQLMAGKIIGIALVALTQFVMWGVLTVAIILPLQSILSVKNVTESQMTLTHSDGMEMSKIQELTAPGSNIGNIISSLENFNWTLMIITFVFFFIGGYLLYASFFAAIGSAVDNEADTQQFMLPVTIPLILAFILAQTIVRFPDGNIAFWFSIIPLTSPVIMPVRIAADAVPIWELILSMVILVASFIGSVWFASKIYRVGILMYGKKPSYKELWKWMRYK